jgi:WD40 repeat protein
VSICFHPDAVVLAVGTSDGHLLVLNAESGNPVSRFRVCGSSLNCVAYSPSKITCFKMKLLLHPFVLDACLSSKQKFILLSNLITKFNANVMQLKSELT